MNVFSSLFCRIVSVLLIALMAAPAIPARAADVDPAKKVLILGIDGLDPKLLQQFSDEGALPNFTRLMNEGHFSTLQTTMPPLSPVAWSTFITGMDPGGHGIFDFVHRDPADMSPYLSMARPTEPGRTIDIGTWSFPLSGGGHELLRHGKTFWEVLEEHGVPTTVFKMPANFPPHSPGKSFSGMGTPDLRGTPGTFSFFTTDPPPNSRDISGGAVYEVAVRDNVVESEITGPPNSFRRIPKETTRRRRRSAEPEYVTPDMKAPFTVYLDPEEQVAKIVVGDEEFILREGEWSDFITVKFEAIPYLVSVEGIARFYMQEVRPDFRLYVSPIQISPANPAMPISTPEEWAPELSEELGLFYTQELPEDTKALSGGIFTGQEFWTQTQLVYDESRDQLDYFLERWEEGLLFFYFSSIDQNCHMLWRYVDHDHPGFNTEAGVGDKFRVIYQELDEALGRVLEEIDDDTTLIVMSDHGFAPFYWGVNLNSWLVEKGYVVLKDPSRQGELPYFMNVDWSRTTAYALGLNGVYVNQRGREKNGIVDPGAEREEILARLEKDMLEMRDPRNGAQPITLVVNTRRDFQNDHVDIGPDLIVGYNSPYRSSWESPLGEFPREIFVANTEAWSGDHAMDYRVVPGVLLSNRRITMEDPALYDLTVAVLDEYGVAPLPEMIGRDCLASGAAPAASAARSKETSEPADPERTASVPGAPPPSHIQ